MDVIIEEGIGSVGLGKLDFRRHCGFESRILLKVFSRLATKIGGRPAGRCCEIPFRRHPVSLEHYR